MYQRFPQRLTDDRDIFLGHFARALFAGVILTYAQGMALLLAASEAYEYHLDCEAVARIWRGGCIIRAALLEDIRAAFQSRPELPNCCWIPAFCACSWSVRKICACRMRRGEVRRADAGADGFLELFRRLSQRLAPANLIQAQRDYFGSHTYERIDAMGAFHTEWEKSTIEKESL